MGPRMSAVIKHMDAMGEIASAGVQNAPGVASESGEVFFPKISTYGGVLVGWVIDYLDATRYLKLSLIHI